MAPATRAATPATMMPWESAPAAATPSTRLAVEIMPSFAPRTAARSQPIRCVLCLSICLIRPYCGCITRLQGKFRRFEHAKPAIYSNSFYSNTALEKPFARQGHIGGQRCGMSLFHTRTTRFALSLSANGRINRWAGPFHLGCPAARSSCRSEDDAGMSDRPGAAADGYGRATKGGKELARLRTLESPKQKHAPVPVPVLLLLEGSLRPEGASAAQAFPRSVAGEDDGAWQAAPSESPSRLGVPFCESALVCADRRKKADGHESTFRNGSGNPFCRYGIYGVCVRG